MNTYIDIHHALGMSFVYHPRVEHSHPPCGFILIATCVRPKQIGVWFATGGCDPSDPNHVFLIVSRRRVLFPRLHPGSGLSFFRRFQCNGILLPWQFVLSVGTCWNHHEPAISAEGVDTLCMFSMIVDAQAVPVLICCVRPLAGEVATVHAVQCDKKKNG